MSWSHKSSRAISVLTVAFSLAVLCITDLFGSTLAAEDEPMPHWQQEIYRKLGLHTSIDFVDAPLADIVSFMEQVATVKITIGEDVKDDARITLRATDVPYFWVLNRICRWTSTTWYLRDGHVALEPSVTRLSSAGFLLKGNELADAFDWDGAIAEYTRVITQRPRVPDAYFNRGFIYQMKGDFREAHRDYTSAIQADPKYAPPYYNRACIRMDMEDTEGAIRDFSSYLKLAGDNPYALDWRGYAYFRQGSYDEAIADLSRVIQQKPAWVYPYYYRGYAYMNNDDQVSAIRDFNQVIKTQPSMAAAYLGRAEAHYFSDDTAMALKDASEAIRIDADYVQAYDSRGFLHAVAGRHRPAIRDCTKVIELVPNGSAAYNDRGWTYVQTGQYGDAICDLDKAIRLEPLVEFYESRGWAHFHAGNMEKAEEDAKTISSMNPDSGWVPALLYRIRLSQGRREEGLTLLRQHLKTREDNEDAPVHPLLRFFLGEGAMESLKNDSVMWPDYEVAIRGMIGEPKTSEKEEKTNFPPLRKGQW